MPLLNTSNFLKWKSHIEITLKKLGLYRVTKGTKLEPIGVAEKRKWFNGCDEVFGTLCISISLDLLFHVESCNTPQEVWAQLELLFGKLDTLKSYQYENELISLNPSNFDTIQNLFTKLKSVRLQ